MSSCWVLLLLGGALTEYDHERASKDGAVRKLWHQASFIYGCDKSAGSHIPVLAQSRPAPDARCPSAILQLSYLASPFFLTGRKRYHGHTFGRQDGNTFYCRFLMPWRPGCSLVILRGAVECAWL